MGLTRSEIEYYTGFKDPMDTFITHDAHTSSSPSSFESTKSVLQRYGLPIAAISAIALLLFLNKDKIL